MKNELGEALQSLYHTNSHTRTGFVHESSWKWTSKTDGGVCVYSCPLEQWRTHTFVCWRPPDSSNVPESVDHVAKCHLKPLLTSHHDCYVVFVVLKKKKKKLSWFLITSQPTDYFLSVYVESASSSRSRALGTRAAATPPCQFTPVSAQNRHHA